MIAAGNGVLEHPAPLYEWSEHSAQQIYLHHRAIITFPACFCKGEGLACAFAFHAVLSTYTRHRFCVSGGAVSQAGERPRPG